MTAVHVVVPEGVDDPTRPSGGNTYDLRVCAGLARRGWAVSRHEAAGRWPGPDAAARQALGARLAGLSRGSLVLVDGLVASAVPEVLVAEARRLRVVVLLHLPRGHDAAGGVDGAPALRRRTRADEGTVLRAAAGVIVPSRWTRDWVVEAYGLAADRVDVVAPGVDAAPLVAGGPAGSRLACIGAVVPTKGQDRLVDALADVTDLSWSCQVVGSLDVEPSWARRLGRRVEGGGLGERVRLRGPLPGPEVDAVYADSDLLVVPSRIETYGLVVTEALARGIPVVASHVGGLPEALGDTPLGRPGVLVPPDEPAGLARALRRWLTDAGRRADLRSAARARREALADWSTTADGVSAVLSTVRAGAAA
ncbi:glycosyltransferase family 4 protein [Janibacter terrae]|uniref:glycosyltransferase family 4 protein n=1 Tax=Janibacter terrae TaxID=103817 RepID=UPI0031F96A52